MSHIPVMLAEVLRALSPRSGETIIDGTFGAGGYSEAILRHAKCDLIALDRDPNVRPHVERLEAEFGPRFIFKQIEFSKMHDVVPPASVDGVVLDIGVSSMQLDQDARGFSFMREGPLDMRMSGSGVSARDVIDRMTMSELTRIFRVYGEEKRARRCADFVVKVRAERTISTTTDLADIISKAIGRSSKHHPATRVFQALRIYVNDELGELVRGLSAAERVLKPGGRLVVVSFHSLEARIVKKFFRSRSGEVAGGSRYQPVVENDTRPASFRLKKRGSIKPKRDEEKSNPRSRSAHLRYGVRTDAHAWPFTCESMPGVPSLEELERRAA